MAQPSIQPRPVILAQRIFYLNAAIWLVFGILGIIRLSKNDNPSITLTVVAILLFGNVGAMLVSGLGLAKRNKRFYLFALAVLIVNILLTFTDQFGFFDFLTLLLDLGLLWLLIPTRKLYWAQPTLNLN